MDSFNIESSILIADDDEYFRLALVALLRDHLRIADVEIAASMDEAMERLANASKRFTLALFNLSMPGVDGPEALSIVRERFPEVRIAIVSASRSRKDVIVALHVGIHGFISRALGPLELVRALKIVMSGDIFVPSFIADLSAVRGLPQLSSSKRSPFDNWSRDAGERRSAKATISATDPVIASISPRQREVLAMLVRGFSNKQIAKELSLGEGTVKIHVAALLRNLGVPNRAGAAAAGAILLSA